MLPVQAMCLSSGFSFSYASCHCVLVLCLLQSLFVVHLFSLCWFTAHGRTASVPEHPECSQSSEPLIISSGVSGIC